jgi:hypothetical protein
MAAYHGKNGLVYLSTTGSGNASALIRMNAWSLDEGTDKAETTSFGDANKVYVQGLPDVSGSLGGFWDDTEDKLFTGATSGDGVKMYLYPSSLAISRYWYGPAWVDFSIDVGVGDAVSVSGSFSAAGSWGRK